MTKLSSIKGKSNSVRYAIALFMIMMACAFFFDQEAQCAVKPVRKSSACTIFKQGIHAAHHTVSERESKQYSRGRHVVKRHNARLDHEQRIARLLTAPTRHAYSKQKARMLRLVLDRARFVRLGSKTQKLTSDNFQARRTTMAKLPSRGRYAKLLAAPKSPSPTVMVARPSSIDFISDGRVSANIENRPINEVLRVMSEKNMVEIKGALPQDAFVSAHFSNFTPEQAVHQVMQGYNYALIKEPVTNKLIVVAVSKSERSADWEPGGATQKSDESLNSAEANTAYNSTDLMKLQQLCGRIAPTDQVASSGMKVEKTTESQTSAAAAEDIVLEAETETDHGLDARGINDPAASSRVSKPESAVRF